MEKKPEKSRSSRTVSRIVRATSWALASAGAWKAGSAIGIFGRAAPTMRRIGTEGIGASGGGACPSCRTAAATAKATPRETRRMVSRVASLKGSPGLSRSLVGSQGDFHGKGDRRIGERRREGWKDRLVDRRQDRSIHRVVAARDQDPDIG